MTFSFSSIQADDETETDVPQIELPLVKGQIENEKNEQTWTSLKHSRTATSMDSWTMNDSVSVL